MISTAIDWPRFLQRQDPVWRRIPGSYFEGPFVGNGLVGTIMYRDPEEPGSLRFEVGRTDVWDHRLGGSSVHDRVRLPIGQLLLTPVGELLGCDLRIDLWNAEIRGHLTTTAGTIGLRCFAPSEGEVLVLDLEPSTGESACAVRFRPQQGTSPRWLVEPDRDWHIAYQDNPPFRVEHHGGIEVAVQPLLAGGDYATAWTALPRTGGGRTILATTAYRWAAGREPSDGSAADALGTLHGAAMAGIPALEAAHRAWWHAYYPASFLSVPDPRLESFYWIQLYKLASATRGDRPVVDLMGPWFQVSVWAAYWQNLNTQLPYYLPGVANHPEFCEAPSRLLERRLDQLIANVPPEWRHDSAALGNPTGYDSLAARAPGPVRLKPGQRYSFIALPWLVQQYYLHARFTADEARLRDGVYPLMRRTLGPFLHTLVREEDGRWHLPMSFSDEYGQAEDANQNLALLRWLLETLLALAERFALDEPIRGRWREVLAHLAPPPVDPETGLMIGRGVPFAKSHRHSSHLFAVFPFHLMTPERTPEAWPVIERSLRHFTGLVGDECMFKFTGASSLWATFDRGDEALAWLQRSVEILSNGPTIGPNTLYSENGSQTFESPLSAARSLTDLMLQSRSGIIHVFPAWPGSWPDGVFHHLRAEGAFLVSARRREGRTEFVAVRSLAGEPCRLRPGLAGPIRRLGHDGILVPDGAGVLSLTLAAGEEAELYSGDQPPEFTIRPLDHPEVATWGLR